MGLILVLLERLLYMIIDVTGIALTPGNSGKLCKGNGKYTDKNGVTLECCCDECDYAICCFVMNSYDDCNNCFDTLCPHSQANKKR